MIRSERLLIVGGTGRNVGKSSLAEILISKFSDHGVTGIKITPHDHPEMSGLTLLSGNELYNIYEEHSVSSGKDTTRMLRAGALQVFLIVSEEKNLKEAFNALKVFIPPYSPVICESPALRRFIKPDLFIIMMNQEDQSPGKKNIVDLLSLSDLSLTINDLDTNKMDVIDLDSGNRWHLSQRSIK